MTCTQ